MCRVLAGELVTDNPGQWLYMVTEFGHSTPFSRAADQVQIAGLKPAILPNWVPTHAAAVRALDAGDDYFSYRDKRGRYCQLRRYPANTRPREARG